VGACARLGSCIPDDDGSRGWQARQSSRGCSVSRSGRGSGPV
jgi:hypothetical protein